MIWEAWWVWMVAGLALGILEVLVPVFVFLGFAVGAILTGALVWLGAMPASLPWHLLVFAVLSLVVWLVLRRLFGARHGQVKVWHTDINDN